MLIQIASARAKPKTLKISQEDYDSIVEAVEKVVKQFPAAYKQYKEQGLSDMRYNWDVFNRSGWMKDPDNRTRIYSYLNDNHINAALAFILNNSGKKSPK